MHEVTEPDKETLAGVSGLSRYCERTRSKNQRNNRRYRKIDPWMQNLLGNNRNFIEKKLIKHRAICSSEKPLVDAKIGNQ